MYKGVMIPRKKGGKGTAYLAGARWVVDERLLLCTIFRLHIVDRSILRTIFSKRSSASANPPNGSQSFHASVQDFQKAGRWTKLKENITL